MQYGTWSDFISKYGFSDGDLVKDPDVKARNRIVAMLNQTLKGRGITPVAYDRPGLHNYCLVCLIPDTSPATITCAAQTKNRRKFGYSENCVGTEGRTKPS
jgi:hypothetical protein